VNAQQAREIEIAEDNLHHHLYLAAQRATYRYAPGSVSMKQLDSCQTRVLQERLAEAKRKSGA